MTRYVCNFESRYRTCTETKHGNNDRVGHAEVGYAGYLWTRPRNIYIKFYSMTLLA